MPSTAAARRPTTRARDRTQRLLIDAAVRVFARKGFHASRVGDIAEEAGVAHGLLYTHGRQLGSFHGFDCSAIAMQIAGGMLASALGRWKPQQAIAQLPLMAYRERQHFLLRICV